MSHHDLLQLGAGMSAFASLSRQDGGVSGDADFCPVGRQYTALVVDDDRAMLALVSHFAKKHGLNVVSARDGEEAVEVYKRELPDLVLMDVVMPIKDGRQAALEIKNLAANRWVPILFLSASGDAPDVVRGLLSGGDDYIVKPVNFEILGAKLRSLERTLDLQKEAEAARKREREHLEQLRKYAADTKAEALLAHDILNRQLHRGALELSYVTKFIHPAADVSGDIVAAAPSLDGECLYVMIGDATGHGLAASIATIPVLSLFYHMAPSRPALAEMVAKINDEVRATMPVSRFVTACIAVIDRRGSNIEIWNGGMPPALMLDAQGGVIHRFESISFPMGIIDSKSGALSAPVCVSLSDGARLLMMSDGLVEAENEDGADFGMTGIENAVLGTGSENSISSIEEFLHAHLHAVLPHDDLSAIQIDLDRFCKETKTRAGAFVE